MPPSRDAKHNDEVRNGFSCCFARQTGQNQIIGLAETRKLGNHQRDCFPSNKLQAAIDYEHHRLCKIKPAKSGQLSAGL